MCVSGIQIQEINQTVPLLRWHSGDVYAPLPSSSPLEKCVFPLLSSLSRIGGRIMHAHFGYRHLSRDTSGRVAGWGLNQRPPETPLCLTYPSLFVRSTKTPKHAVFAGSMQLLAGIKLCTGRVLTNHPHYEDKDLRERTQQV